MTPEMKALVDAPLADPGKINLPAGRRPKPKSPKAEYHCEEMPRLSGKQLKERKARAREMKLGSILSYYAGTTIPFDRIATHTGLDLATVTRCMKDRGRAA